MAVGMYKLPPECAVKPMPPPSSITRREATEAAAMGAAFGGYWGHTEIAETIAVAITPLQLYHSNWHCPGYHTASQGMELPDYASATCTLGAAI